MINQLETLNAIEIPFEAIWNLKPTTRHTLRVYGKEVKQPRYTQGYLTDYYYSGALMKGIALPKELEELYSFAKRYDSRFNQILVNWYENGTHYIAAHSDDEPQLVNESPVLSISYGATRKFRIRDKETKEIVTDLLLDDNTAIVMKGDFQKKYTHEIVKMSGKKGLECGRRINVTFRCFKKDDKL